MCVCVCVCVCERERERERLEAFSPMGVYMRAHTSRSPPFVCVRERQFVKRLGDGHLVKWPPFQLRCCLHCPC